MITPTLVLSILLAPQSQTSESFLAETPISMSANGIPSTPPGAVLHKEGGVHTTPPQELGDLGGNLPNFTRDTMFPGVDPAMDINGMSFGASWNNVDVSTGRQVTPSDSWTGQFFSVTKGTRKRDTSVYGREMQTDGGGQADVFVYFAPDSGALPVNLRGNVFRLANETEIRLRHPATGVNQADLTALDGYLGGLPHGVTGPLPDPMSFYFTVANPEVTPTDNEGKHVWYKPGIASTATVLRMTWTNGSWTQPTVAFSWSQLEIGPARKVDALAVDVAGRSMIYSTDYDSSQNFSALRVYTWDEGGKKEYNGTLLASDGETPVSQQMGMGGSDDIDSLCCYDPRARYLQRVIGHHLAAGDWRLSLSSYVKSGTTFDYNLESRVRGTIAPPGTPETLQFMIDFGSGFMPMGPLHSRSSGGPAFQNLHYISPDPSLVGLPADILAVGVALGQVAVSNVVRFLLQ